MGLMVLSALVGVSAAVSATVSTRKNHAQISRYYGITGVTSGNTRYTVEIFDYLNKFCGSGQTTFTCCGKYTSSNIVSVITKSRLNITGGAWHSKYTSL